MGVSLLCFYYSLVNRLSSKKLHNSVTMFNCLNLPSFLFHFSIIHEVFPGKYLLYLMLTDYQVTGAILSAITNQNVR